MRVERPWASCPFAVISAVRLMVCLQFCAAACCVLHMFSLCARAGVAALVSVPPFPFALCVCLHVLAGHAAACVLKTIGWRWGALCTLQFWQKGSLTLLHDVAVCIMLHLQGRVRMWPPAAATTAVQGHRGT